MDIITEIAEVINKLAKRHKKAGKIILSANKCLEVGFIITGKAVLLKEVLGLDIILDNSMGDKEIKVLSEDGDFERTGDEFSWYKIKMDIPSKSELNELEKKGLCKPKIKRNVKVTLPPKFPGKALSKYLDEIR